jgi:alkanesulfonate monooxygenase SsuD/methylene tetrahydromethanopterin reductase-like flavin-dependent oxidoreductase (luciferase family)
MLLGINLPSRRADGTSPDVHELMARAKLIEDLGFDGIWMGDTVGRWDHAGQDTLQWLLAAAAGTRRVEIGTAVLQLPLRNPVELAQRLISLAALSGGRFVAGVGSGSTRKDFEALGLDINDRFRLLREGLPVIKRLIKGETVGVANHHPAPNVIGRPPIVLAAWHSGPWIARAAKQYDGWIASGFAGFNTLREGIKRYRDEGGTGRCILATINVDLRAESTPLDEDGRFTLQCGPEEAADRMARIAELGFDTICCSRLNYSGDEWPEEDLAQLRSLLPRDAGSPNAR